MSKSSFSEKQKQRIYEVYTEDNVSQKQLANLYNVSQGTISNVIKEQRSKAEINQLKHQQTLAMAMGVKAFLHKKGLPINSTNYLED